MISFRRYYQGDILSIADTETLAKYGISPFSGIDEDTHWTAIEDNIIIGVGGFRRFWQGVYEAWIFPKSYEIFYKHKIIAIKYIKKQINWFCPMTAHRIQATIVCTGVHDERLIKFLGFKFEGILSKYGPEKQNYLMFARTE